MPAGRPVRDLDTGLAQTKAYRRRLGSFTDPLKQLGRQWHTKLHY
jgi:hypothetical protein